MDNVKENLKNIQNRCVGVLNVIVIHSQFITAIRKCTEKLSNFPRVTQLIGSRAQT